VDGFSSVLNKYFVFGVRVLLYDSLTITKAIDRASTDFLDGFLGRASYASWYCVYQSGKSAFKEAHSQTNSTAAGFTAFSML
jgi:hypothetical protein